MRIIGVSIAFFVLLGMMACERGDNVTFRNETSLVITLWQGAAQADKLQPGESKTYSVNQFPGKTTYRITDDDGNVLFQKEFTFEELRDYGDIVVTVGSPSASPP